MLLSIGEVATIFGVSTSTIRRWEKANQLTPVCRTLGGHRRYRLPPQLSGEDDRSHQRKTILYARVSGSDQRHDLMRQQDSLLEHAKRNSWSAELYSDLGSGLKYDKPGLRKLATRYRDWSGCEAGANPQGSPASFWQRASFSNLQAVWS